MSAAFGRHAELNFGALQGQLNTFKQPVGPLPPNNGLLKEARERIETARKQAQRMQAERESREAGALVRRCGGSVRVSRSGSCGCGALRQNS